MQASAWTDSAVPAHKCGKHAVAGDPEDPRLHPPGTPHPGTPQAALLADTTRLEQAQVALRTALDDPDADPWELCQPEEPTPEDLEMAEPLPPPTSFFEDMEGN